MKYMLLLNNSKEQWDDWHSQSPAERQKQREESIPRWNELFGWMSEQGIEATGLELEDPANARVVRVRDGEADVVGARRQRDDAGGGRCLRRDDAVDVRVGLVVAQTDERESGAEGES